MMATVLATRRIGLTRLLFIPLLAYIILTPPWETRNYLSLLVEILGYVCLVVATLGRVWCLTYIGGYKQATLITDGPYSIVRNPLYLFSFIGGVGLGLATEHPTVALVILCAFGLYYPFVVDKEEHLLEELHGEPFLEYKQRTPRWIPHFKGFTEPEVWQVKPIFIRRGMLSAMWFLWLYMAWEIIEKLQSHGVISG